MTVVVQKQDVAAAEPLKIAVLDTEDLAVMSAHLQDALVKVGDLAFLPKVRRFALVVCRIDWDHVAKGQAARRSAGFHFERVAAVQRSGFDQADPQRSLQILAVSFVPTDEPEGEVVITFSGGASLKLQVECLEAEMRDLSDPWPCDDCPRHPLDEAGGAG